ncbi:HNH endonuclease [Blastomonas sp.]|uniref:HNH endonuclease n=1 Tax=Blastomonas sp. TaxID=1909299 RepID=UPI0035936F43
MAKRRTRDNDEDDTTDEGPPPVPCWLCGRDLGDAVEWHHPVPKSRGGKARAPVHPICHQTIHAHFTNSELGRTDGDPKPIRDHPEVAKFLTWLAGKPADFNAPTRKKDR